MIQTFHNSLGHWKIAILATVCSYRLENSAKFGFAAHALKTLRAWSFTS
jgi:hypothetical protein